MEYKTLPLKDFKNKFVSILDDLLSFNYELCLK